MLLYFSATYSIMEFPGPSTSPNFTFNFGIEPSELETLLRTPVDRTVQEVNVPPQHRSDICNGDSAEASTSTRAAREAVLSPNDFCQLSKNFCPPFEAMGKNEVIGSIEVTQLLESAQVEWKISDFSSIDQTKNHDSPTFSFEGASWHLDFCHGDHGYIYDGILLEHPDAVFLRLNNEEYREYSVEYDFGFKKLDDSVEQIGSGIMEGEHTFSFPRYYLISKIMQRKSELLLSDTLTIVFSLKRKEITEHSIQPTALSRPQHKVLIKLDVLSENLRSIFANKETCDTTLNVKGKEYKAHKTILMARSPVFAAMFMHDTAEKQTGIINIPDCDPESFEEFLEYLYCGKLENLSSRSALHLYETSDKYDIQELKDFCVECLMETLTVENLCDVVIIADKYDDTKLFSAAQRFFNSNFKKVLLTSGWDCLLKTHHRLVNKLLIEM